MLINPIASSGMECVVIYINGLAMANLIYRDQTVSVPACLIYCPNIGNLKEECLVMGHYYY